MNITDIENLIEDISLTRDTHIDYISLPLQKLQSLIILKHADSDNVLDVIIRDYVSSVLNLKKNRSKLVIALFPITAELSYRMKLQILERITQENKNLVPLFEKLKKLNKYRNEFAHPEGMLLNDKYNSNTPKGRERIYNLLKYLKDCDRTINSYFETKL